MKSPDLVEKLDEDQGHRLSMTPSLRPMFCNVCGESLQRIQLGRVTLHGLACEVCKVRLHKECLKKASICCKWTTLTSMGKSVVEDDDGNLLMPHQWMSGNFAVNSKCVVCQKPCGSILRIQDFYCLWCQSTVHKGCKEHTNICDMGAARLSILPPTHVNMCDDGGFWRASKPPKSSPLLVFVNTKSGDHQGVKMLRKFKQLLNPVQVFDLMQDGTFRGLKLFQDLESFRVLVCGGDGSVGWVLDGIDRLGLHKQCQVGILPLGTGNDLSRVMGWGGSYDDDSLLPHVLERLESAQIQMFDRWSILSYETASLQNRIIPLEPIVAIEDTAADHLSRIIYSQSHNVIITSAMVLCGILQELVSKVSASLKVHKKEDEEDYADDDDNDDGDGDDENEKNGVKGEIYEGEIEEEYEYETTKIQNDVDDGSINADKIEKMKQETDYYKSGKKINRVNSKKIIIKKRIKINKKRKNKLVSSLNVNDNYHMHNGHNGEWKVEEKINKKDKKADEINKNKKIYITKKRNTQSTENKNVRTVSNKTKRRMNTKTRKYSEDSLTEKCDVLKVKMEALLETLAFESAQLGNEEDDDDVVFVERKCSEECDLVCCDASNTAIESNKAEERSRCHGDKGDEGEHMYGEARKSSCDSRCRSKSPCKHPSLISRNQLMQRANSLKKAIRHIVQLTEQAVDEQNRQTVSFKSKISNRNMNNNENNNHKNINNNKYDHNKNSITNRNGQNNIKNDINVIKTSTQSPKHSNLLKTTSIVTQNNVTTSYFPVKTTTKEADDKTTTTTITTVCNPLSMTALIGTKPLNSSTHANPCIDDIHDIVIPDQKQTTPNPSFVSDAIQHAVRQMECLDKQATGHTEKQTSSINKTSKTYTFETTLTDTSPIRSLATSPHTNQKTCSSTIPFDYQLCHLTSILQPESTHSSVVPTINSIRIPTPNNFSNSNQMLQPGLNKNETHTSAKLSSNLSFNPSTNFSTNVCSNEIISPIDSISLPTKPSPLSSKSPPSSIKLALSTTKPTCTDKSQQTFNKPSTFFSKPQSPTKLPQSPTKVLQYPTKSPQSPTKLPPSSCAPHMIIPSEIFIFPVSPEVEDRAFSDVAEQTDSSDESSNSSSPHNTPSLLSPFYYNHSHHHHHHDQSPSPQQPSSPSYHHDLVPLSPSTDAQRSPQQHTPSSLLTPPSCHHFFYPPNHLSHHYHHSYHHQHRHSLSPSPLSPPQLASSHKRPSSSSSSSHHHLDLLGRWSPIFGMPSLPQVTSPRLSPVFYQRKNIDGDDEEENDVVNLTHLSQTKDTNQSVATAPTSSDPTVTVSTAVTTKKGRRISSLSKLQQKSAICCPSLQASSTNKRQNLPKQSHHNDFPILNLPLLQSLPKQSHRKQRKTSTNQPSLISRMLLANADAICAPISPFNDLENVSRDDFTEKCVMSNYFGIGLDAKIALDFHNKRQGHPSKCSSRTKNIMWYGVLGGKEVLQRTHKKLDQKVRLECDGKLIPLPNLQGIVVLNIPSYMGGINFWGGYKENDGFLRPSSDDRVLEVVAVFGSMQLGISRVINLHKHRIAQCRSVKISIIGEESLPVQVDGEAWMQKPGIIWISHKNRAQLLTRDRSFEEILKSWKKTEKKEKLNLCTVKDWSQKDIECWLNSIQMELYIEHFKRHDVKGEELLNLKRCDIKELGISKVGHVKRLMKEIKILKSLSKRCIDLTHKQISSPK